MRIEPQAASRLEAMPVALIAQSVTVLAQNAESLRRTIDAFVLGNPLLEYAPAGPNPAEALDIAELAVARRATLAEHLGMQLRIAERDPEVLRIGRMIIESLDKYGYLREHTEDMLRAAHASPAAFARALAAEPRILVLDEPESNLDFRNQMVVLNVIERLTEQGLGAVINTHFPAHALEISTKTLLVPRHRPPIFGDTRDVMTEDLLSDVFDVRVRIRELDFPERRYTCVAAVEPRHGGT